MRKIAIATAMGAAMALSACGSDDQSGTFSTEDGEGSYSIDRDGDDVNIQATSDDGDFSFIIGEDLVADLPLGFSTYPGAEVVTNMTVDQDDGGGSLIVMHSDDTPEEMLAFYREQAEDAGIEIKVEMKGSGSFMLAGEGPDGQVFSFNANGGDDGETTANLMIGKDVD